LEMKIIRIVSNIIHNWIQSSKTMKSIYLGKPYNSVLGEYFNCFWFNKDGSKTYYLAEQISHHPPITAMVADGEDFQLHQNVSVDTKFRVNRMELQLVGGNLIQLKGHEDEYYYFGAPGAIVHNLIVGKLWIDHCGDISITCIGSERRTDLHFKKCGWFSKGYRDVLGSVYNAKGKEMFQIRAKWNDHVIATRVSESKTQCEDEDYIFEMDQDYIIWKNTEECTKGDLKKWKFTDRTVKLCEINDRIIAKLPKSDSRFRPDRILLQNKEVGKAGKVKHKLEDTQRKKRKYREKK